jgi:hypothetical protein
MTDTRDHEDVIARLVALGDALDVTDDQLVDGALVRVAARAGRPQWRASQAGGRRWLVAAGVALFAAAFVAHPSGRDVVARWFGLDGVSIQVDPSVPVVTSAKPFAVPGPGESEVLMVDGREVLFSAVDGRLSDVWITKVVQSVDQISEVRVGTHPGLWIAAGPHQVSYESPGGHVVVTRVASNTLLWEDGPLLFRVEGFDELEDALEFAAGT